VKINGIDFGLGTGSHGYHQQMRCHHSKSAEWQPDRYSTCPLNFFIAREASICAWRFLKVAHKAPCGGQTRCGIRDALLVITV